MKNPSLFLWAKKIHRWLVLIAFLLTVCMTVTGLMLHEGNYLFLEPAIVRIFHNKLSIMFSIILGTMAITGTYLFFYPYLGQRRQTS